MQTTTNLRWPQAGWLGARLRLRQRALSLAKRLHPKPTASAGTPKGNLQAQLDQLRDKYERPPVRTRGARIEEA